MNKIDTFNEEYKYIKNESFIKDIKFLVDNLPDYFFEIEASSTGKYHPRYALGSGGLVRHTKAAVRVAYELLNDPVIGDKYSSNEKDLMIMGLILHDGLKLGKEKNKYTKVEHPILASNYIKENKDKINLSDDELNLICGVIESHMGPWNKDYDGNEVLPVPTNKYQSFVHMCDYLASRKFLNVDFDDNNNVIG